MLVREGRQRVETLTEVLACNIWALHVEAKAESTAVVLPVVNEKLVVWLLFLEPACLRLLIICRLDRSNQTDKPPFGYAGH